MRQSTSAPGFPRKLSGERGNGTQLSESQRKREKEKTSISSWLPGKDWSVFDDHACSFPPFLCAPSVWFFGVHLFVLLACLRLLSLTSPVLIQAPMRSSSPGDDDADHFSGCSAHCSYISTVLYIGNLSGLIPIGELGIAARTDIYARREWCATICTLHHFYLFI
jgi:hypothetical protein